MKLLYGEDAAVADWVARRLPDGALFGPCAALGFVTDGGRLVAGVVFHNHRPANAHIEASMAAESPIWARPALVAYALGYPFAQLGCWMVYTLTPPGNAMALKVNAHLGFRRKTVIPHAYGKKRHAVLCQMLRPTFNRIYGTHLDGHEIGAVRAASA